MYCSKCGTLVPEKLNYCNNCGDKIAKGGDLGDNKSLFVSVITAVGLISILGLGLLLGLVAVLLENTVKIEAIMMISIAYLITLFGINFSLIRLMSKLLGGNSDKKTNKIESFQPPQLSIPTNPRLGEYQQPLSSVTDSTTRLFDEQLVERK